ncbi:NADP-dependent oxidoreductase [Streptomyces sp. Je 1-4]|uniref:MDR family NADP-dependent oxidoreductase n=1 Tax=Streptomyces TaxID=1883 RepID=UPI0021D968DD|nr:MULTISPECIES: NADP-dependent oxidoreductase [unclassified Streptomyces]UYB39437.1 NADP-dependent oxidoreductase [Streptomyces sp. Je 1-4]UZQ35467.1 NADP-dependent oxidoreductase [Streptomyces sp. Je 1-4] [Streptomyces sp. Je 1-4 4N24]UZQ42885.1 NADP-dependent oxidoreductase [Streptomyces sp. Je 1-4] [Streptomyces sp. Je 1-4 4N24_ara]
MSPTVVPGIPSLHREVRLAARAEGELTAHHFMIAEVPVPEPEPGQVLVRNRVMAVTAAMRTQMTGIRLPMASFVPGQALWGSAVGEVVAAPGGGFTPGELVQHPYGWREFAAVEESRVRSLAEDPLPTPAAHLSQGATAWGALRLAAEVRPGDTVFISGAAGGVGSLAGQLARRLGAGRVVGSTGSERKAARLRAELGYDDTVVRGAGPIERQLRRAAPDGIDVLLDTVGGEQLTAALAVARADARFALVGALSSQLGGSGAIAPVELDPGLIIMRRVALRGFGLHAHPDLPQEWAKEFGQGLREGSLVFPHALLKGIQQAPRALSELTQGRHIGAVLVEL